MPLLLEQIKNRRKGTFKSDCEFSPQKQQMSCFMICIYAQHQKETYLLLMTIKEANMFLIPK